MSSRNYRLFERAMKNRKQILCVYDGYPRELCPVILGHTEGQEKALTISSAAQAAEGCRPEVSGVVSPCRRSAMSSCVMDRGLSDPVISSSKSALRRSISM
jgi:hypothetical protein